MSTLEGKIALVTGASRGIGRGIARRLAQEGVFVIVHYASRHDEAKAVVRQIEQDGGKACSIRADLSSLDGINHLFLQLEDIIQTHTGTGAFDILVNNAGIG